MTSQEPRFCKKEARKVHKGTRLLITLAVLAVFMLLAAGQALATPSLSPDKVTCTPCHTDGRKGDGKGGMVQAAPKAEQKAAPAKTEAKAPAKTEAKAAPKAAPAPAANTAVSVKAFGKTATLNGKAAGKAVLVPLRDAANLFFASLSWDAKTKTATIKYNGKTAAITLNKDKATVDGKEFALDARAQLIKGQTYVPAGFVAAAFGSEISGDLTKGFAVNAALPGYVGSDTCAKCHQAQYKDWQGTRHSRMVQDAKAADTWYISDFRTNTFFKKGDVVFTVGNGLEGGQRYVTSVDGQLMYMTATWDAENRTWVKATPSKYTCGGCHNTGYNPKSGSWAENSISCEACHGPGAEHAKTGDKTKIKVSTALEMCTSCHGAGRQGEALGKMWVPEGEENTGGHTGLFAHEIDKVGAPDYHYSDRCLGCHAATYIVAKAEGKKLPTYDDYMKGALKSDRNGITCVVCHDPHKNTGNENQLRKDLRQTCQQCHDAPDHHPSGTVMEKGGPIYKPDGSKTYVGASKQATCEQCHMIEGSHTFTPAFETIVDHGVAKTFNACAECHTKFGPASDVDPKTGKPDPALTEKIKQGQAAMRAVQAEVEEKFEPLKERQEAVQARFDALKKADPNSAAVKEAEPYVTAAFKNMEIYENDGSKGIHNMKYVDAVFAQLEADLAKAESLLK